MKLKISVWFDLGNIPRELAEHDLERKKAITMKLLKRRLDLSDQRVEMELEE